MPKNHTRKPLEIKISTVVAVAALIGDTDQAALSTALTQLTGGSPDYFDDDFTVLDFAPVTPSPALGSIDWVALIALFKSHHLNPVAVRNIPAKLEDEVRAHGLAIDNMVHPRQVDVDNEAVSVPAVKPAVTVAPVPVLVPAVAPSAAHDKVVTPTSTPTPTMVIESPIRGGQRIYARGGDLVLMGVVNPGAEVIADGSIHVYAPLRGRALAGASGNAEARIFSLAMEAELVSIAGVYRTFDEGWPKNLSKKAAQVSLVKDKLEIIPIALVATK